MKKFMRSGNKSRSVKRLSDREEMTSRDLTLEAHNGKSPCDLEINEPLHEIFQQCGILTCVYTDEPLQSPFKLRNSKWCSVSSLTIIEYSSN